MNSSVCVDASLVIWALVPSPLSEAAQALLAKWHQEGTSLLAPSLLAFEVTSSLRRLVYLREITPSEGEEAFACFLELDIRLSHRRDLLPLAWQLAKEFNRPRAYDTVYLALAKLRQCDLWTADERLYNAVSKQLTWVKWIGNFSP